MFINSNYLQKERDVYPENKCPGKHFSIHNKRLKWKKNSRHNNRITVTFKLLLLASIPQKQQ